MIIGVIRTTKFAAQNFWRNLWLSLVTVFLLVLTTFSITLVISLNVVGQQVVRAVESRVDIDLLFYPYVSEDDILEAQRFFDGLEGVSQVIYTSQDDAEEQYRENHKDDVAILASLDELGSGVLPASLTIRADDLESYPVIIEAFEASKFTDFVEGQNYNDNKSIIDSISQFTNKAYQIGLVISFIFIIISVIVIFNTIRIAIYNYRESIGIMKLVGATNMFIRSPFIMEGALLGIISAVVTLLLFYGMVYLSDAQVSAFFAGYDFSPWVYFIREAPKVILAEFIGAVGISVISSMVAITRYLRV